MSSTLTTAAGTRATTACSGSVFARATSTTITAPSGATVYTGTTPVNAGSQIYTWNGVGNDGNTWPAGSYTLTATAVTASGQSTTVTTQVAGQVSSVDLTQTPPVLTIGGQNYTINDIQRILAPGN